MKTKFNENYFMNENNNDDNEIIKDYTNYSFIDLDGKNQKNDIIEQGFEICKNYIEVAKNDWEVISQNSDEDD